MRSFNTQIEELMEERDPDIAYPAGDTASMSSTRLKGRKFPTVRSQPGETALLTHAQYQASLHRCWNQPAAPDEPKGSFLIYGRPGVGKSMVVKRTIKTIAPTVPTADSPTDNPDEEGFIAREPALFNEVSPDKQQDIINNPGKYFVLLDVRTAQMDRGDFQGIPKFTEDKKDNRYEGVDDVKIDHLVTVKYKWAHVATHPDTAGYLFFDEINQGAPEVLNAMYAVILDRTIFDKQMSPNLALVAAGNLAVHDPVAENETLNQALIRRFNKGVGTLTVEADEWLDWAISEGIHPSVIAFICANKSTHFHSEQDPSSPNNRFADPDSITALSKFIYNIDKKYAGEDPKTIMTEYERVARSILGGPWGNDFVSFMTADADKGADKFFNPGNSLPSTKWSGINIAQRIVTDISQQDSSLSSDQYKLMAQGLVYWLKSASTEVTDMFNHLLDNHDDENISEYYNIELKERLEELADEDDTPDHRKAKQIIEDLIIGKEYKSSFVDFQNPEESTNLLSVSHAQLSKSLEYAWDTGEALLIYGEPGIGKSWAVSDFGRAKAEEAGLQFINVFKEEGKFVLDTEVKILEDVKRNPENYFMFIDVRVAQMEPSDFMGIPDFFGSDEYLSTKKYLWAWLATRPKANGIIFFDEINQASPETLKAMFSVVNADDKFIFDSKISDNMLVIGAGNLASQEASTAEMETLPLALTRRFKAGSVVLELEAQEWFAWALKQKGTTNEIHSDILLFLQSQDNPKAVIFYKDENFPDAPIVTPDTHRFVSQSMRDVEHRVDQMQEQGSSNDEMTDIFISEMYSIITTSYPPTYAKEFLAFLDGLYNIDWDEMYKNRNLMGSAKDLAQVGGVDGTSAMVAGMYQWIPKMIQTVNQLLVQDKNMKYPITGQRVRELFEIFTSYNENMREKFLVALHATIGIPETHAFFIKYGTAKNPHLSPELLKKVQSLTTDLINSMREAREG